MSDDKIIITADQAIELLATGDTVHNFSGGLSGVLLGCDYDRAEAIACIKGAALLEIAGPAAMEIKHAIVVHEDGRYSFFKHDPEKMSAYMAARETAGSA